MPSNVRQLLENGTPIYPITEKSLVIGLQDAPFESYIVAWDGASTPVVANIPAGVTVTYNTTTYTGTLAASSTTAQYLYLVASTSQQGEYDRYITTRNGSSFAWTALGSTAPVSPVIADNLTTNDSSKALSAKQGVVLEGEVSQLELKVTDITVTSITKNYSFTGDLAVNAGSQYLAFPFNYRPGHHYAITIESDTNNTGYIKFSSYNNAGTLKQLSNNIWQNINGNPYTFDYDATEQLGPLRIEIRVVAVVGTLSVSVVETWDESVIPCNGKVDICPGVNLANPDEFTVGSIDLHSATSIYKIGNQQIGNAHISNYIPLEDGESLVCNVIGQSAARNSAALFEYPGDLVPIQSTYTNPAITDVRTITNNTGSKKYAVFVLSETPTNVQIEKGTVSTQYAQYNPVRGYFPPDEVLVGYGTMGDNYPDEVKAVLNSINAKNGNGPAKLHFVHISDNHGNNFGYANEFTDVSPASFLVNTGDLVADKYADSYDTTKNLILAMTKPGFVILGNHDCKGSTSLQNRFDKFIAPLDTHNGLTGNTKTYYSVDYATEKVKCIFLDMNDGRDDVSSLPMGDLIVNSIMSQTQINWFAAQLQDAISHSYDVACFVHTSPDYVDETRLVPSFYDAQINKANGIAFLCDIVDAFLEGGTVAFDYNGNSYSFTFATAGHFVGWFCGHMHCDSVGWMKNHPKQFHIVVCRPGNTDQYDGTYRTPKLGVTWNYVSINTYNRHLSVKRMGNNETIYGTMRDAFDIQYK